MAAFKAKRKGDTWERDAVELLNKGIKGSLFKRIPGSGAIGTSFDEPLLTGDLSGKVEHISKKFKVECKTGYGGSKQLALKKEWLDKIVMEAKANLSIPILMGKFSGARSGVQYFVVMDLDTFTYFVNELARLNKELSDEAS